jgi:hypothetical protein
LPSTVGTLPTISALPLAVVSLRALRAEGGGEAVVGPLLTELQTQQVDGGFSLDQAELLTDAVPLGRGRRLQGISAGAPYLHRVLSCNLKGACLIVLGFHLRNRPFVNQNSRFPFSFQILHTIHRRGRRGDPALNGGEGPGQSHLEEGKIF